MEEELNKYVPAVAESVLQEVKNKMVSHGILLARRVTKTTGGFGDEVAESVNWVRPFFFDTTASAFYLGINSPDDLIEINTDLETKLSNLQSKMKLFLVNNSDLEEDIRSKINTFATSILAQAKKAVKFGLKNGLKADKENCRSLEDLREAAGRRYADFIRKEVLERIMVPLYDGVHYAPDESAYQYILTQVNNFLAELGVLTVPVSVGAVYDENMPYEPSEVSQEEQYKTENIEEKDKICAILRYAYAFQEDKEGVENRRIMDGSVIVKIYREGDNQ